MASYVLSMYRCYMLSMHSQTRLQVFPCFFLSCKTNARV